MSKLESMRAGFGVRGYYIDDESLPIPDSVFRDALYWLWYDDTYSNPVFCASPNGHIVITYDTADKKDVTKRFR